MVIWDDSKSANPTPSVSVVVPLLLLCFLAYKSSHSILSLSSSISSPFPPPPFFRPPFLLSETSHSNEGEVRASGVSPYFFSGRVHSFPVFFGTEKNSPVFFVPDTSGKFVVFRRSSKEEEEKRVAILRMNGRFCRLDGQTVRKKSLFSCF